MDGRRVLCDVAQRRLSGDQLLCASRPWCIMQWSCDDEVVSFQTSSCVVGPIFFVWQPEENSKSCRTEKRTEKKRAALTKLRSTLWVCSCCSENVRHGKKLNVFQTWATGKQCFSCGCYSLLSPFLNENCSGMIDVGTLGVVCSGATCMPFGSSTSHLGSILSITDGLQWPFEVSKRGLTTYLQTPLPFDIQRGTGCCCDSQCQSALL